jgi:hypothetical protein
MNRDRERSIAELSAAFSERMLDALVWADDVAVN